MPEKTVGSNGLLPDSAAHIARLEARLNKLKKVDQNKLTGKEILKSMNQLKEIHMNDYFRNSALNQEDFFNDTINKSYIERKIAPEQPINTEETLILVENDHCEAKDSQETSSQ